MMAEVGARVEVDGMEIGPAISPEFLSFLKSVDGTQRTEEWVLQASSLLMASIGSISLCISCIIVLVR